MRILVMEKIRIGDNSQIGINCVMDNDISIGCDVVMGPDVIIYSSSHEYRNLDLPINQQGMMPHRPVKIGDNVWIGTRCIILPGVTIGSNCIIGAGTIVTKNVPDNAVFCGQEGKVVKIRS